MNRFRKDFILDFLFYFRPFVVFLCKVFFVKLLTFYQMTSYPPWSLPWQGDKGVIWDCIWDPPNLYHFLSTDQHKKSVKFAVRNLMVSDYSPVHTGYRWSLLYLKILSSNTSEIAYKGDFQSLCTVTFWQKDDFLISNAH